MFTAYRNPWYKLRGSYGPSLYTTTDCKVEEYRGFYLVHKPSQIDIVEHVEHSFEKQEFVCIHQVVTARYAKRMIDKMYEEI